MSNLWLLAEADSPILLGILLMWGLGSLIGIYRVAIARPRAVIGPARLGRGETAWVLLELGMGVVIAFLVSAVLSRVIKLDAIAGALQIYILGTAMILVLAWLVRDNGLSLLGIRTAHPLRTFVWGVVGFLMVLPWVYIAGEVVTYVSPLISLPPPAPHPVLEELNRATLGRKALLFATAVIFAPIFEELVFRGLIQTLLGLLFGGGNRGGVVEVDDAVVGDGVAGDGVDGDEGVVLSDEARHRCGGRDRGIVVARWMAILVTSVLFAASHGEVAFFPPLLILSIGLGFAYEATGNLWVNITMHALFNCVQMTLILLMGRA